MFGKLFRGMTYYRFLLWVEVVGLVLEEILPPLLGVGVTAHVAFAQKLYSDVFCSAGIIGGLILYWNMVERRRNELLAIAVIGTLLEAGLYAWRMQHMSAMGCFPFIGTGWGSVAIVCLLLRALRPGPEQEAALEALSLSVAIPVFTVFNASVSATIAGMNSNAVYDMRVYTLDGLWGAQPSFIFARMGFSTLAVSLPLWLVYNWLSVWMLLSQLLARLNEKAVAYSPLLTFLFVGIVGQWSYKYFPCVGTQVLCGIRFPMCDIPVLADPLKIVDAPAVFSRATVPSLHLAWALTAYWVVEGLKPSWRYTGACLFWLTAWSTFSVGNHYLFDLLVAVPFSVGTYALAVKDMGRNWRLALPTSAAGFALFVAWVYALKEYPAWVLAQGWLVPLGLTLTVIASLWLRRRLVNHVVAGMAEPNA